MDLLRPTVFTAKNYLQSSILKKNLECNHCFSLFSFVTVILKVLGLKKPAFERLFSQMTAHFVSTVFKNSVRYIYTATIVFL